MRRVVDVAVIGCGLNTEVNLLPALCSLPFFNIRALVDTRLERAEKLARQNYMSDAKITTDYKSILDVADAIVLATPPSARERIIRDCIESGKHVFCEKPLAATVEEARRIAGFVAKASVKFTVGFQCRFIPNFRTLRGILKQGLLGDPWGFSSSFFVDIKNWQSISGFQFEKAEGGALFDTAIHLIDLARWFFGDVQEARATISSRALKEVDDTAVINLVFENGVAGTLFTTWHGPTPVQTMEIVGDSGTARTDTSERSILYRKYGWIAQAPMVIRVRDGTSPYVEELRNFGEAIAQDVAPLVSVEDGLKSLEVIESLRSGFAKGSTSTR